MDNFDLVKRLLALPWYNLILISLLIVPLFIGAWSALLSSLNLNLNDNQKRRAVLVFIGIYLVGLFVGKIGYEHQQSSFASKVRTAVMLDLKSNGGIMGFKKIRERHPSFTEELLTQLAENFPGDFEVTSIADPSDPSRIKQDPHDPFGLKFRSSPM